jgi:tRNA (cmo5U34)-methyltransferase
MRVNDSAQKFDPARAGEYEAQSRIALAGYEACHELSACMLAATIGQGRPARVLVVGAGGGAMEIRCAARLEPQWTYLAIDPSQSMMDIARYRVEEAGLTGRTEFHTGWVQDLVHEKFDAATLIGVLHHIEGNEAKHSILTAVATMLKPGAPLILAGNRFAYTSQPLSLTAWGERWRMQGASPDEVRGKLAKILQGADPPHSEEAVAGLLTASGFEPPQSFFSSLFWGAWITKRI